MPVPVPVLVIAPVPVIVPVIVPVPVPVIVLVLVPVIVLVLVLELLPQRKTRKKIHWGARAPGGRSREHQPESYEARTPNFFKKVIIGHQLVKADWNRFNPTNAVKANQYGCTQ